MQLVEVADSAVLGGVAEVVSSIPTVGYNYFSAFTGVVGRPQRVGRPQTSSSPQQFYCWPSQGGSSVLAL